MSSVSTPVAVLQRKGADQEEPVEPCCGSGQNKPTTSMLQVMHVETSKLKCGLREEPETWGTGQDPRMNGPLDKMVRHSLLPDDPCWLCRH